jgi:hypothetical protein
LSAASAWRRPSRVAVYRTAEREAWDVENARYESSRESAPGAGAYVGVAW